MITITFELHTTTFDNENSIASGWNDVRLSPTGINEAKQLGQRYANKQFDAVFCSDLRRCIQTATLAFDLDTHKIFADWRLRECDYGSMTGESKAQVETQKIEHIDVPFVDGESYTQVMDRIASFLADLKARWEGKQVLIIGHKGTHYGLEHWINNKPLDQCLSAEWIPQPGWEYQLQ